MAESKNKQAKQTPAKAEVKKEVKATPVKTPVKTEKKTVNKAKSSKLPYILLLATWSVMGFGYYKYIHKGEIANLIGNQTNNTASALSDEINQRLLVAESANDRIDILEEQLNDTQAPDLSAYALKSEINKGTSSAITKTSVVESSFDSSDIENDIAKIKAQINENMNKSKKLIKEVRENSAQEIATLNTRIEEQASSVNEAIEDIKENGATASATIQKISNFSSLADKFASAQSSAKNNGVLGALSNFVSIRPTNASEDDFDDLSLVARIESSLKDGNKTEAKKLYELMTNEGKAFFYDFFENI